MSWVRKAQISMEYLLVIGFVTVAMLPLTYLFYTYTKDSGDEIVQSQLHQLANEIVEGAESVYYLGEPSQKTIKTYVPSQVIGSDISQQEVKFTINTREGDVEIAEYSEVNITGSLPPSQGTYRIIIKAQNNFVNVTYE